MTVELKLCTTHHQLTILHHGKFERHHLNALSYVQYSPPIVNTDIVKSCLLWTKFNFPAKKLLPICYWILWNSPYCEQISISPQFHNKRVPLYMVCVLCVCVVIFSYFVKRLEQVSMDRAFLKYSLLLLLLCAGCQQPERCVHDLEGRTSQRR